MDNPAIINPYQPIRPRHDPETGEVLLYRTRPKKGKYNFHIHTYGNQLAMINLYRAVHRGEVPLHVSIADLYQWLADGEFAKRNLGAVVVNSVDYEPRKLYNNSRVEKAVSAYAFRNMLDLQFGLEWMICTWLRKFINGMNAADQQIKSRGDMAEELQILASCDENEFHEIYTSNLENFIMEPIYWQTQSEKDCWDWKEVLPEEDLPKQEPRTPPRDLGQ